MTFTSKHSNFHLSNILTIIPFVVKCNLSFVGWFQPEHNLPMSPPSHSYIQASLSPGNASASTQIEETLLKVKPVAKPSIIPTPMRIGFLGLGIMGQGMVMNLLRSGHEVTVWNRTALKVSLVTALLNYGFFLNKGLHTWYIWNYCIWLMLCNYWFLAKHEML